MMKMLKNPLIGACGTFVLAAGLAGAASANENPFNATPLKKADDLTKKAATEGQCGAMKKGAGEGKCGANHSAQCNGKCTTVHKKECGGKCTDGVKKLEDMKGDTKSKVESAKDSAKKAMPEGSCGASMGM